MSLPRFTFFRSLYKLENLALRRYSAQNSINLSDPAVQTYLNRLMLEHANLETKPRRNFEEARRLQEIKPIVLALEQRIALFDSIDSLKELNKRDGQDEEIKQMIKEEAQIYLKRMKEVDSELQSILLEPVWTKGGVLVEVTTGAGGQEAMLFARELFEMYQSYCGYKDWEVDIASVEKSDLGGIRKASFLVNGLGKRLNLFQTEYFGTVEAKKLAQNIISKLIKPTYITN